MHIYAELSAPIPGIGSLIVRFPGERMPIITTEWYNVFDNGLDVIIHYFVSFDGGIVIVAESF